MIAETTQRGEEVVAYVAAFGHLLLWYVALRGLSLCLWEIMGIVGVDARLRRLRDLWFYAAHHEIRSPAVQRAAWREVEEGALLAIDITLGLVNSKEVILKYTTNEELKRELVVICFIASIGGCDLLETTTRKDDDALPLLPRGRFGCQGVGGSPRNPVGSLRVHPNALAHLP